MEDEKDVEEGVDVADAQWEADGENHGLVDGEHHVGGQGAEEGPGGDGEAVDGGGKVPCDVDDRVYIRGDHPPTRRLGEHKPSTDPAREDGEEQPQAEG